MDLLDYKIGSPLYLDIFDEYDRLIDTNFVSQFEEPADAYEAIIAVPIVEGVIYAVRIGWYITVYSQDGNDFYRFQARVTSRFQQDGRALMGILRVSDIDVAQRRKFYRFKCSMPFRYSVITEYKKGAKPTFTDSKTEDISGSGLSFLSVMQYQIDSLIECEIPIEGKIIFTVGKIKRCIQNMDAASNAVSYQIGVLFTEIEEYQREAIIKYIFNEERRQMKKRIA